jgi:NAD(P)-dependent dehydrogenase (short-subunit alcohol dehydrogenase family)
MTNIPQQQRIVVMTGATAGLGAQAVHRIAARPDTRIIIGARSNGRTIPGVEVLPLDLASLDSVRGFADAVIEQIGHARIDVLVLNAGTQSSSTETLSADGFELTFAVNHLAHYLLARLLEPYLADGGRLVITTSDTHDPKVAPIGPKSLDPQALAHPTKKSGLGTGMRAYASSKLCNLLTVQSFAARDDIKARRISVVAFNPGLTGGTSLSRESSPLARAVIGLLTRTVFRLAGVFKPEFVMSTAERSGELLAEVALGAITPPAGRIYVSLVKGEPTFPDPSELARSRDARDRLWHDSAAMVGLTA